MDIGEAKRPIGRRLYEAAEFLVDTLLTGEKPSAEVIKLAEMRGIALQTLKRAQRVVMVKSRKSSSCWYMTIPENARELFESWNVAQPREHAMKPRAQDCAISADWVSVAVCSERAEKIMVPASRSSETKPGLRVKHGAYELEVDEDFPAEKLAALLHKLGGEIQC